MGAYRVLLADDERWIRSLLRSIVSWRKLGAEIVGEAEDGLTALALCRIKHPDILISDVRMPAMSGLELIEKVREELPHVQCVVISGYDEFQFAQRALRLGVVDYLLKPLDARQVETVLRRAVGRLQAQREDSRQRKDLRLRLEKMEKILTEQGGEAGDAPGAAGVRDRHIRQALRYIDENLSRSLTLREVAEACFLTPSYFSEKFKSSMRVGFCCYLNELRMKKAARLVASGELKCREVAEMLGFSSESYFSRVFKKTLGCTPEAYRRQARRP